MMTVVQFKYSPQSPIQKAQKTSTLLKNVFSENINCPFCVCVCVCLILAQVAIRGSLMKLPASGLCVNHSSLRSQVVFITFRTPSKIKMIAI